MGRAIVGLVIAAFLAVLLIAGVGSMIRRSSMSATERTARDAQIQRELREYREKKREDEIREAVRRAFIQQQYQR